ncbi:MAG: polyhydroxyalkanoate synthesis regulator DNA-binding domain-containing protein [Desulfosalsimonadaceae bacterium]
MSDKIRIKKYPNRRLYDSTNSVYVSLNDVSDSIKKGARIEVIDVKTGEDVTAFILTQIIMNKAKDETPPLPVSLLHLIIQYGENLLHEFFEVYLEKTIENYLEYKKRTDDQIKAFLEMGMDFSNLAEKTFKNIDPAIFFSKPDKKE